MKEWWKIIVGTFIKYRYMFYCLWKKLFCDIKYLLSVLAVRSKDESEYLKKWALLIVKF